MKSILILLIAVTAFSCSLNESSCTNSFYELKPPIRIAGTNQRSITVVDSDNKYLTLNYGYNLTESLYGYKVGDTIIYNKIK